LPATAGAAVAHEGCDVRYRVKVLPTLGGDGFGDVASDINNKGQVTGSSLTATGDRHAFLWTRRGGIEDLGTLDGGDRSVGDNINERGDVVGTSATAAGGADISTFTWTRAEGMRDLGPTTSQSNPEINDRHQVAGEGLAASGDFHAFRWTAAGAARDLGTLGGHSSQATGINESGKIVGLSLNSDLRFRAFLWTRAGGMQDLGTLRGDDSSSAYDINDRSQVVGDSRGDEQHAFLWTKGGGMEDLGNLGGPFPFAVATDINNRGHVIGFSETADGTILPFVWSRRCGMRAFELLEPGFVLVAANGVNDRGQIVGEFCTDAEPVTCGAAVLTPEHDEAEAEAAAEEVEEYSRIAAPARFSPPLPPSGQEIGPLPPP
jgi:probable HAF family extracellular repeat protein